MKRCVIVGGAPIENYERVRSYLKADDYVIYCDCGLKHREGLGAAPNLIVGDFDSFDRPSANGDEIIELCPVKDDTDSAHAVTVALERGYEDFLLIGMTGRRMDHTLGNLYMLHRLDELGKIAMIVDDYSEISLINREPAYIDDSMPFFSLINLTGLARGVTIENAKYPLQDYEIVQIQNELGISNEVLPGQIAKVTVREGKLLLIRDIMG